MVLLWVLLMLAAGDELTHLYSPGDPVTVYFNKVTPRSNPQEVSSYLDLPLCLGTSNTPEVTYQLSLGEVLEGDSMVNSHLYMRFLEESKLKRMCSKVLSASDALRLRDAIRRQFWLQMYIDDLPVWGSIGKVTSNNPEKYSIYTELSFVVYHDGQHVTQVLYQPGAPVEVESPDEVIDEQQIEFFVSIVWVKTKMLFEDRMGIYRDTALMESGAHWGAVCNSVLTMLLMCGFVGLILSRTLSKDHQHERHEVDTMGSIISEAPGWKTIGGEVFRAPSYLLLFTACVGAGTQLAVVAGIVLGVCALVPVYWERGVMTTMPLTLYCLSSFFGGLKTGSFYLQHRGKSWVKCMIVSHAFLPCLLLFIYAPQVGLSLITTSLPLLQFLAITLMFLFIATPLYVQGTILGRKYLGEAKNPYQISVVRQPILREKLWYQRPWNLIAMGGILPFACIAVETYLVFNCLWGYKVYYTYGVGLAVFIVLIVTQCCVSIIATYLFLCAEDYRWQWVSFLSAASTAFYLLMYSLYYYVFRTEMTGVVQFACYFCSASTPHTGFLALCLFLVSGTVGHFAASQFVRLIYTRVKHE